MIVIPALDLRAGVCTQASVMPLAADIRSDDPIDAAHVWERHGFRRLHLMDLDSPESRSGRKEIVRDLLAEVPLVAQVGGGVNSGDQVQQLLADGAAFVILGGRALADPDWLAGTAATFPDHLIVATRVNGRYVDAGEHRTEQTVLDLADELGDLPLAGILLAPEFRGDRITHDDLFLLDDLANASHHPVLLAGGIRTMQDLRSMEERGVFGVIVGRALYSGALDARLVAEEFGD
jgi:phosphoribosylformimino-5-aminoimidazole carboxamide ribonucleotide (ProFAR) isomerase